MPGTGPRAKNWCFTLNNYTPADLDRLSELPEGVTYLIYGKEIGESGTPHLQGTVCFQSRKRLPQVIAVLGQCHCSITRYLNESITYCKKEGDFIELGDVPNESGHRSDLEAFKNTVKSGVYALEELREQHSAVCARYPRFVNDYVYDSKPKNPVEPFPLMPWQEELNNRLKQPPDKRHVIFIVDRVGNKGKSWFARYFCGLHDNAQIIVPGKKADMAYVVREDARTFFLDCPRSKQGEFIQYDFLEELKNGYLFSSKYESRCKTFPVPHVVVMMNEHPDEEKLSADRYSITNLT